MDSYIPYSYRGDLHDGYASVAEANPVLAKALEDAAREYRQGKSAQGNPRGFTYIPGDNPERTEVLRDWGDLIVFMILRWLSQESFMLRQTQRRSFVTLSKAQLPVNLLRDNIILQAEVTRESKLIASGSGQVARPYVLPSSAKLWLRRIPFSVIGLQCRFVTLVIECRLTDMGVEGGRVFAAYVIEVRVRPRIISFLTLIWPWELQMMDAFMSDLPDYFGLGSAVPGGNSDLAGDGVES